MHGKDFLPVGFSSGNQGVLYNPASCLVERGHPALELSSWGVFFFAPDETEGIRKYPMAELRIFCGLETNIHHLLSM